MSTGSSPSLFRVKAASKTERKPVCGLQGFSSEQEEPPYKVSGAVMGFPSCLDQLTAQHPGMHHCPKGQAQQGPASFTTVASEESQE